MPGSMRGKVAAALTALVASGCSASRPGEAVQTSEVAVGISVERLPSDDIARVEATISGPGIPTPIVRDLVQAGGQWGRVVGPVPLGVDRIITGRAYDSGGALVFEGEVPVDVGATTSVILVLRRPPELDPSANGAPRVAALLGTASQVEPMQTATLRVIAVDADGDPLHYAWTATGGTLTAPSGASVSWTAPPFEGTYTVSVEVTDGRGGQAGISTRLVVAAGRSGTRVNPPFNVWPAMVRLLASPGQVKQGETTLLDAVVSDADGDDLTYSWTDDCAGVFGDKTGKSTSWQAPATYPAAMPTSGRCTVTLAASDGRGGSTTDSAVFALNFRPVIDGTNLLDLWSGSSTVYSGDTVSFWVQAHDPEGKDIDFVWTDGTGTLSNPVNTASTSTVEWVAPDAGYYRVTVQIGDADGEQTAFDFGVQVEYY